jgi:hypothetical protein
VRVQAQNVVSFRERGTADHVVVAPPSRRPTVSGPALAHHS